MSNEPGVRDTSPAVRLLVVSLVLAIGCWPLVASGAEVTTAPAVPWANVAFVRPGLAAAAAATILARPLFAQSRRPTLAAGHEPGRTGELPRLSGIIITPSDRRAIFGSDKPVVRRKGDSLGPYTIVAIRPSGVLVQGQSGMESLSVQYGSDQAGTARPATFGPSLLDKLNNDPPPRVALPGRASLIEMLSRLPRPHS